MSPANRDNARNVEPMPNKKKIRAKIENKIKASNIIKTPLVKDRADIELDIAENSLEISGKFYLSQSERKNIEEEVEKLINRKDDIEVNIDEVEINDLEEQQENSLETRIDDLLDKFSKDISLPEVSNKNIIFKQNEIIIQLPESSLRFIEKNSDIEGEILNLINSSNEINIHADEVIFEELDSS
jgi:hypothetical protein